MTVAPRFGANYVPSKGWWYSWIDWDESAIADDFAAIASLGLDHVRVHCLWPLFQPNAGLVSSLLLDRLRRLLDVADEHGLDVVVTVFNGWLSGFDFRPHWIHDSANIFGDRAVVDAQLDLLTALAGCVGGHARFLGFDIANEPSVLAGDTKNVTTQAEGDAWLSQLLDHCERVAPGGLHSVGMDHMPWITSQDTFSRAALANTGSLTPIHAWTFFTGALERYGAAGTGTLHLTEYMLELAKAFAADPARLVWLQEYGVAHDWMDAEQRANYVVAATLATSSVAGLWGVTWWCSHDIDRSLKGFDELEYDLGLITARNEVKPLGALLRDVIAAVRCGEAGGAVPRPVALVLPDAALPDLTFADEFFALIDSGLRPSIVLASRAGDVDYLAQRDIAELRVAAAGESA